MPSQGGAHPPLPLARALSDQEGAAAASGKGTVSNEPPYSAGLADRAHFWLNIRSGCGAATSLTWRYLAATNGWKTPLSDATTDAKPRQENATTFDLSSHAPPGRPQVAAVRLQRRLAHDDDAGGIERIDHLAGDDRRYDVIGPMPGLSSLAR